MTLPNYVILYLKKLYLQFGMEKIHWEPYFYEEFIPYDIQNKLIDNGYLIGYDFDDNNWKDINVDNTKYYQFTDKFVEEFL